MSAVVADVRTMVAQIPGEVKQAGDNVVQGLTGGELHCYVCSILVSMNRLR